MCWAQKAALGCPPAALRVSPRSGKGQFSARHYVSFDSRFECAEDRSETCAYCCRNTDFVQGNVPTRIVGHDRIIPAVGVFVQAERIAAKALERIVRPESACVPIVIAGAQVVEAQVWIELFAGEEVVVRRDASAGDQVAEGIVVVRVGHETVQVG